MTAQPLTDRGRRTRDALVASARGVFEERGYDATRMSDLAAAAGVSHGTVYTWFATKDAVLAAVVEQAATSHEQFQAVLADLRATHVRRVAATIDRLQREGEARRDLDPQVTAAALCAMVEGFARHWFGRGETYDEAIAVTTLTALWTSSLALTAHAVPDQ